MSELHDKARDWLSTHDSAETFTTVGATLIRELLADNERLEARVKESDIRHSNTLIRRDRAEETIDKMLDLLLGVAPEHRPEWSNAYGFDDAVQDVEEKLARIQLTLAERQAHWRDAVARAEAAESRLRELASAEPVGYYWIGNDSVCHFTTSAEQAHEINEDWGAVVTALIRRPEMSS